MVPPAAVDGVDRLVGPHDDRPVTGEHEVPVPGRGGAGDGWAGVGPGREAGQRAIRRAHPQGAVAAHAGVPGDGAVG
jgi:hypothetical protein